MSAWLQANAVIVQALANIAQIVVLFLVFLGLLGTARQVRYAASQAQGATVQETAKASRDLAMKMWDDNDLRPIVDPKAKSNDPERTYAYLRVVTQHYATIYRQWKLGNIPARYWEEVKTDAGVFFSNPATKGQWRQVKQFYQKDFQDFVEGVGQPH